MDLWGRPAPGETRHPVLMRREAAPLPTPDPRVTVARTVEHLQAAERALATGLEAPGLRGVLGTALLDQPVACAYAEEAFALAHDDGTTVGVYLVGTAERARGRGLGTAVTAAAMAALPPRPALLTATTRGRPVYERLGFRVVGRATMRMRERG
jgi:GNAT superfamily N-acetyltransferase